MARRTSRLLSYLGGKLCGVFICVGLALTGCAPTAQQQASHRMMTYRDSPAPLPVTKTAFTSPLSETSLESAAPTDEGGARLRDVLLAHPDLGSVVQQNGIPDAITLNQGENSLPLLAFFYLNPPRTLLFAPSLWSGEFGVPYEIKEIPRSVRRLTFEQGPMPPPWPVTVPAAADRMSWAPKLPDPPRPDDPTEFTSTYAKFSADARGQTKEVRQGAAFDRASKAFARLDPSSKLPGFNWQLVVIHTPVSYGFAVPDGTLFVSDGLITMLSDDELVAIIAHLLGHEAYGHGRSWYLEAGPVKRIAARVGAVTAGTVIFGVGVLGCGSGSPGACEGGLKVALAGVEVATADFAPAREFPSYSHDEEVQANFMAARYLTSVGIATDALFDALAKVASATVPSEIPANAKSSIHDFVEVHQADWSAAEFGRMLDAGLIQGK